MRRAPYLVIVVVAGLLVGCGQDSEGGEAAGDATRPPLEAVARSVALEPEKARAVRRRGTRERPDAPWVRPLATPYEITTRFGDPRARGARGRHGGTDLAAPEGTPVAAAEGTVMVAGRAGGYGNLVTVQHVGGVRTRYAHLSEIDVVPGQPVRAGQRIGRVGDTGRSFGPHLHLEVRVGGVAVDPGPWFLERGRSLD